MFGTRHQIVVAQAMQQGVDAVERIDFSKAFLDLFPQDRPVVRRQSLLGIGSGVEHRAEFPLLLFAELGRGAGLTFGNQRIDAARAVAFDPLVHELP